MECGEKYSDDPAYEKAHPHTAALVSTLSRKREK